MDMGVKLVVADAPGLEFTPMPSDLRLSIQIAFVLHEVELLGEYVQDTVEAILHRHTHEQA